MDFRVKTSTRFKVCGAITQALNFLRKDCNMSFESENSQGSNSGLDILKPPAQTVGISLIDKYRADLQYLESGKMTIEAEMANKGIDDAEADKKLDRLSKSIKRLKQLIEDYEKEHDE